jgi:hypothetical protein
MTALGQSGRGFALVAVGAGLLVRALGGCALDDLELGGKQCPCVAGFVCDVSTNTCVAEGSASNLVEDSGNGSSGSSGSSGGPLEDAPRDAPRGGFTIQRFAGTWVASKSVRWEWDVAGLAEEFAEYQVVTAPSIDSLLRQDSTALVFDRRINPELGSYGGRIALASGDARAVWTVTDRHLVGKPTFARLVVRDKLGRENVSEIVTTNTIGEPSAVALFADQVPAGATVTPPAMTRVTTDCFSPTGGCLQLKVACPAGAMTCPFEIGLGTLNNKDLVDLTAEQFKTAFVELAIRGGQAASPRPHADLVLTIGAPACRIATNRCRFRFVDGATFRPIAKEYRLIQVPLSALQLETPTGPGQALQYEDLVNNAFRIDALTFAGEWTAGATIGVDRGFVRW